MFGILCLAIDRIDLKKHICCIIFVTFLNCRFLVINKESSSSQLLFGNFRLPLRRSDLLITCESSSAENQFALDRSFAVLSGREYGIAFPARACAG